MLARTLVHILESSTHFRYKSCPPLESPMLGGSLVHPWSLVLMLGRSLVHPWSLLLMFN